MPNVAVQIEWYALPSLACTRAYYHIGFSQLSGSGMNTYLFDNNATKTVGNE